MAPNPKESIVNASVPSAGRIYDYLLGGHHNFEVDRMTAEHMVQMLPFLPKALRLQRWCLQDIAVELTQKRGFDVIIDFASGLPTQDHIHHVVPEGTMVIYSDYDPVVVEYAREILDDTSHVRYFEADARRPEELLNHPEVLELIGDKRDVGLVYWGVGGFISDDDLAHASQTLHDWAGPGASWVFNAQAADADANNPVTAKIHAIYEKAGTPLYGRSIDRTLELMQPWRPDKPGFISLFDWHGMPAELMGDVDRRVLGKGGAGYGGYFIP
ncbi:MAG: hypothetical protein GXP37_02575 [Chloroflexi bacterium]|nr:hypothetical protein [Chloroflexota bacterium]